MYGILWKAARTLERGPGGCEDSSVGRAAGHHLEPQSCEICEPVDFYQQPAGSIGREGRVDARSRPFALTKCMHGSAHCQLSATGSGDHMASDVG